MKSFLDSLNNSPMRRGSPININKSYALEDRKKTNRAYSSRLLQSSKRFLPKVVLTKSKEIVSSQPNYSLKPII